jgi:diguanylate cyclase (GGDEF)-like protein/PAS domain S-box-containing protein
MAASGLQDISTLHSFDAMPMPVLVVDRQGRCLQANGAWTRLTGLSAGGSLAHDWMRGIAPKLRAAAEAWLHGRLADGLPGNWLGEVLDTRLGGACIRAELILWPLAGNLSAWGILVQDQRPREQAERQVLATESQLRVLADLVPARVACLDGPDGRIMFLNQSYAAALGRPRNALLGRLHEELADSSPLARALLPLVREGMAGRRVRQDVELPGDEGHQSLEVTVWPRTDGAVVQSAFVIVNDQTLMRDHARALRQTQERLRKFTHATREGIVFHHNGVIQDVNEPVLRLLGRELAEVVGMSLADLAPQGQRGLLLARLLEDSERPFETELVHASGASVPIEMISRSTIGLDGTVQFAVVRSIRDRKDAEARIRYLAHHDALTGLPNRAALLEALQGLLERCGREQRGLALLFIDLDNFKTINDSLGHESGDQLLKVIGLRIQMQCTDASVVARIGGDEFVVVWESADVDEIGRQAQRLLQLISHPIELVNYQFTINPSIGIALFPRDGASREDLLKNADAAMYLAKERGRGNYQFFTRELSEQAHHQLAVEIQLRSAILNQEFTLHYQPQVRTEDGRLVGMEALVRWNHPEHGLVGPDGFVAVAEQRGLIPSIGSWVLREACRQNRLWQSRGLPAIPVAVNLSSLQFRHRDIVREVQQVLEDTGLPGEWLELELTESVLMDDSAGMIETLDRLKALGVKIAIDDFGTGYSSLAYLKRYPIDKIKIDRSFVTDIPIDPDDIAITSAIISMAKSLRIAVIAEGVENGAQLAFLRALGCDEVQGYFLSRPLTAEAMTQQLRDFDRYLGRR